MKQMIESLEPRALFTASLSTLNQDASVLQANAQTLRADLQAWQQSSAAAVAQLAIDSRKGTKRGTGESPVRKLSRHEIAGFIKVHMDVIRLLTTTIRDTNAIIADVKQILKAPTAAVQTKLTADIAKLNSDTTAIKKTTDDDIAALQTAASTDLTVLQGFTNLKDDATKAKTTFTTGMNTVMTDLTALTSTITKIATDAAK